MAIDDRQRQIREGAGLEESRLNVEFIDWLRKWSTPMLIVVAVGALGYVGYQKWEQAKVARVNEAFRALEEVSASSNPSPMSLLDVATQYSDVRAVGVMARLRAADAYLAAVRRGVDPGQPIEADGKVRSDNDLMDDKERAANLDEASRLYRAVLEESSSRPGYVLHAIGAAYGLAAVAECRGDSAEAKAWYERVVEVSRKAGFPGHAAIAAKRLEHLTDRAAMPVLLSQAQLPKLPWADEKPPEPPVDAVRQLEAGQPEPSPSPPGAEPSPVPAPSVPPATNPPPP
jgi:hypothetical protein